MIHIKYKNQIINELKLLIKSDYILLDLPYFPNVGDLLIWQATLDILEELPYKCLYSCSIETYYHIDLSPDITIVFMGGGNYGDLWERHQIFRHRVLKDYPHNPIIQLPQSVCFTELSKLQNDIRIMNKHRGGVTLCLRDLASYELIKDNYKKVNALLLPDMVLSFDVVAYMNKHGIKKSKSEGTMFVRRQDSEKNEDEYKLSVIPHDATEGDWPAMDKHNPYIHSLKITMHILNHIPLGRKLYLRILESLYKNFLRDAFIISGIRFIDQYSTIYSTRLHTAILAVLLNKETYIFDNSYGKCSGVYNQWLRNCDNIHLV